MNLVDGETPAARIARMAQALPRIVGDLVLRILAILRPGQGDVGGCGEAGELVDVPAGLIAVHPPPEPDHRAHAEIAAQRVLDVLAREPGLRFGLSRHSSVVRQVP